MCNLINHIISSNTSSVILPSQRPPGVLLRYGVSKLLLAEHYCKTRAEYAELIIEQYIYITKLFKHDIKENNDTLGRILNINDIQTLNSKEKNMRFIRSKN